MRSSSRVGWVFLLAVVILLQGCATPVGVRPLDSREANRRLTETVLSNNELSAPTLQILNRAGLAKGFKSESAIAKVAGYFSPLASLISPFIADTDRSNVARSLKRISEFLKSRALQELLPESRFFQTLCDGPREGISYISAGGTNPVLFTFSHFSFPIIFEKIIPGNLYPEEIQKGRGDVLVSDESAKIPWADEHFLSTAIMSRSCLIKKHDIPS